MSLYLTNNEIVILMSNNAILADELLENHECVFDSNGADIMGVSSDMVLEVNQSLT